MENEKILLAFPNKEIKNQLWDNERYLILEYEGIFYLEKSQKKRKKFNSNKVIFQLNEIRDILNWWNPVLERWKGESIYFEETRLKIIRLVNYITDALIFFSVKKIVHFTGLPHHINSMIVDVAANMNKVKQVFFYVNVIDGRLIPIEHRFDIKNRQIIKLGLFDFNYNKHIVKFISNKLNNNLPVVNTQINSKKTSYYYIYIFLIFKWIKNKIFRIKKRHPHAGKMFYFNENHFSFYSMFSIIKRQKEFLKYYKKNSINFNKVLQENNKNQIIIYANYQPEATSFPEGSEYLNHIDIVLKLRKIGYSKKIYYKEHPATEMYTDNPSIFLTKTSNYKNVSFLKHLNNYNCHFIKNDLNFKNSQKKMDNFIVITITGTIAIERALLGYKTIICGNPYFIDMPGIIHINDIKVKNDIDKIDFSFDNKIKNDSRKYLVNLLSNNTLRNSFRIGTGITIDKTYNDMLKFLDLI